LLIRMRLALGATDFRHAVNAESSICPISLISLIRSFSGAKRRGLFHLPVMSCSPSRAMAESLPKRLKAEDTGVSPSTNFLLSNPSTSTSTSTTPPRAPLALAAAHVLLHHWQHISLPQRRDPSISDKGSSAFFEDSCPAVVLAIVFSFLSSAEVFRFSTLVSKRIASALTGDADLWPRVVCDRLCQFVPARAFFDGPTNESVDSLQGVPMSTLYGYAATTANDSLDSAIARGGVATLGALWTFRTAAPTRRHELFNDEEKRLTLVHSNCRVPTPGALTLPDFVAWAEAFACDACGKHGCATRQCAACSVLLCSTCAVRCDVDDAPPTFESKPIDNSFRVAGREYYEGKTAKDTTGPLLLPKPLCAFAMCADCAAENTDELLERHDVLDMIDENAPMLFAPVCTRCPSDRLLCPAHIDLCILQCHKCEDSACIPHSCLDLPAPICNCFVCQWTVCYRDKCFNTGRTMKHCSCAMLDGCDMAFVCSLCAPDGMCPKCGCAVY
jgi:hypothetical protein